MNYVFEDFLCGFIEAKFKGQYRTSYQHAGWLTDQGVFRMMNDLVLRDESGDVLLIIDAKYKLRQREADTKRGISQADMYQMMAYAMRHNCRKVLLIYPLLQGQSADGTDTFTISSRMYEGHITIVAADLQICSSDTSLLDKEVFQQLNNVLSKMFQL